MVVWALFDSGNGSYFKGANSLNSSGGGRILKSIQSEWI
nr:MAG TPA: hypothetical protein [Caudoviricetes sp.]